MVGDMVAETVLRSVLVEGGGGKSKALSRLAEKRRWKGGRFKVRRG